MVKLLKNLCLIITLYSLFACKDNKKADAEKAIETEDKTTKEVVAQILEPQEYKHQFYVSGLVESDKNIIINAELSGKIKTMPVNEGDYVNKEALILEIDSEILKNNLSSLRSEYNLAKISFKKQENLWINKKIGSEIEYLNAKKNKESLEAKFKGMEAQLKMSKVLAPFEGNIDRLYVKEGEVAMPGAPLVNLVNTKKMYINVDLSEVYLSKIKKGSEVFIEFPNLEKNTAQKSKISFVSNIINLNNRTYRVKIPISNKLGDIKPNLMAKVTFTDYYNDSAMIVSLRILKNDNKGYFLYKANKKFAQKIYVIPVYNSGEEYVEITSKELTFGDKVIIEGSQSINNGSKLKVTLK